MPMSNEFTENQLPPEGDAWREDSIPLWGPYRPSEKAYHPDYTRHRIAVGLLLILVTMALLPTLALILNQWIGFSDAEFREINLLFTPIVALASAAFGFYFASPSKRDL